MTRPDDIVGYIYKAETYCPDDAVRTYLACNPEAPTQGLNGRDAESVLDILCQWANVHRYNESSYDSDNFPKVIFRDQCDDRTYDDGTIEHDRCGTCHRALTD